VPYRAEIAQAHGGITESALSYELRCGLGGATSLESAGDLDNYLVPVGHALGWHRVVAAWGAKDLSTNSSLAVGRPSAITLTAKDGWSRACVLTGTSASTSAWKQEIADQLPNDLVTPADGEVELVIAFTVGPGRAWQNLWKPGIDAMGKLLGEGPRRWHPRDGRISRLGLSSSIDPDLGWGVFMTVWWRSRPALSPRSVLGG
jgi:hypothetical protein